MPVVKSVRNFYTDRGTQVLTNAHLGLKFTELSLR